ncbi:T. brucei spp.-specific protein [Trypanosoma brucei gambiense DAL972]|uniref:T. brucei spp.-specific protein n=1 Tax=Trypanosoma brucei gambiense (strain MHOM/CI/86/DAL972) TaxID=679716 RepID=D0A191_TRYB9|nr:T. brucei spp.-specific protein [Trypanosoma brucei gambiense DAL972]CBH15033.1 T. brucei spp.-specific protein [Trypanosoma brucei gambiense DAL972]|eukprot:XP_011777299.1 T. brucei spp.-specific protein [Trypanosoma brucei gambiense DAL972]
MHRMPFNSFPNLSIDAMTRGAVPRTNPCHLGGDPALPDGKFLRQKSAALPGRKIPKHSFASGCTLNRSPLTGEKPVVYHSPLCSLPLFAPFTPRTPHTFQKLRDPALPDGKFLRQKSAALPGRKIPKHSFASGCTLNRSPLTGEKPVVYHSPLCSLPLFAPFTPRTPHTFQKLRDPRARRSISLSLLISSNPHNLQPHQLHHILKPPRLLCCVFGFCLDGGTHQFQSP